MNCLQGCHIVAAVVGTHRVRPRTIFPTDTFDVFLLADTFDVSLQGNTKNGNGLNQDAPQPEYVVFLRERN